MFEKLIAGRRKIILFFFIPIVSLLMHLHIFKLDLIGFHVWRQTQTQSTIQNFYKEDFNILNPRINNRGKGNGIYRMEFPIMQWIFACFYKVFGDHVIISRILTFIIGLLSVWGIYFLLYNIFKRHTIGLIGAWCFNFSPVFYYYTLNPLPDNFALCASIYGMGFFFKWIDNRKYSSIFWSAFFISIASLAKLPFIVFMGGIGMYLILNFRKSGKNNLIKVGSVFLCFLLAPIIWYAKVVGTWQGNGIVKGILLVNKSNISNLIDILQGNLISTLPELLINYGSLLFFFVGLGILIFRKKYRNSLFSILLFWGLSVIVYFLFEMNMIGTVHDYYMFPFLPLLFIIVAYGADNLIVHSRKKAFKIIGLIALFVLPFTAYLRADHRWNIIDPGFNKNLMVYKDDLRKAVPDDKLCVVGNDESSYIFFYYINKKGWSFDIDTLSGAGLKMMITEGARYLYTDSKKVERDTGITNCINKLILQKGDINVYELKSNTK